ncbi:hypothetical protein [Streptomyces sp. HGB0020]|uniref:hypothetical protein n=1 Tax=Streptomyces sp. HGB0020 TaxID=1078086 RepID=UPI0018F88336|nr:hypothetical protein [Streptomyces sp. HGB0020]
MDRAKEAVDLVCKFREFEAVEIASRGRRADVTVKACDQRVDAALDPEVRR